MPVTSVRAFSRVRTAGRLAALALLLVSSPLGATTCKPRHDRYYFRCASGTCSPLLVTLEIPTYPGPCGRRLVVQPFPEWAVRYVSTLLSQQLGDSVTGLAEVHLTHGGMASAVTNEEELMEVVETKSWTVQAVVHDMSEAELRARAEQEGKDDIRSGRISLAISVFIDVLLFSILFWAFWRMGRALHREPRRVAGPLIRFLIVALLIFLCAAVPLGTPNGNYAAGVLALTVFVLAIIAVILALMARSRAAATAVALLVLATPLSATQCKPLSDSFYFRCVGGQCVPLFRAFEVRTYQGTYNGFCSRRLVLEPFPPWAARPVGALMVGQLGDSITGLVEVRLVHGPNWRSTSSEADLAAGIDTTLWKTRSTVLDMGEQELRPKLERESADGLRSMLLANVRDWVLGVLLLGGLVLAFRRMTRGMQSSPARASSALLLFLAVAGLIFLASVVLVTLGSSVIPVFVFLLTPVTALLALHRFFRARATVRGMA